MSIAFRYAVVLAIAITGVAAFGLDNTNTSDLYSAGQDTSATGVPTCSNPGGSPGTPYITPPPYPPPPPPPSQPGEYDEGAPGTECKSCKANSMLPLSASTVAHSDDSYIENLGFNELHSAIDYIDASSPGVGCKSCGSVSPAGSSLPGFKLMRIHRYRDLTYFSSFGPGVYSNFDMKIGIFQENGSNLIDLFDPQMFNHTRFVDGPYSHPFNPSDPLDGIYTNYKNNEFKEIRLLDGNGNIATDQLTATKAVLTCWSEQKFYFEVVQLGGVLVGRLTRFEDRNGYGFDISYQVAANSGDHSQALWKIDTVTDPHGKQAHFTYSVVSGTYVVSRVDFPNGTFNTYTYSGAAFLSGVQFPDGTASTFTMSFDNATNCTVVNYFDAAAKATSRKKTSFLTSNYTINQDLPDDLFPQGAFLVRMVLNGDGELSYLNVPHPAGYTLAYIFEGPNILKEAYCGWQVRYATSWSWTKGANWNYFGIAANFEPTYEFLNYSSDQDYKSWYYAQPSSMIDETGRSYSYTYNNAGMITSKSYSDGTAETWTYDAFQQPTQYADRSGRAEQVTYDARHNPLTYTKGLLLVGGNVVTTPETATWNWSYYPAGNANQFLLQTSTDANGNVTTYTYDANHYPASVVEPPDNPGDAQGTKTFAYDSAGRLQSSTDEMGRTSVYSYDARNRVVSVLYPDSSTDLFAYGSGTNANLMVSATDRNGNVTTYGYDASGRRTQEIIASNAPSIAAVKTWTYQYGAPQPLSCTDTGNTTTYGYDYRNRLISRTVQPNAATQLTSSKTYVNNQIDHTTDQYGRQRLSVFAAASPYLLRTVQETVPGGVPAGSTISTLARTLTNNAPYLIQDMSYDAVISFLCHRGGWRQRVGALGVAVSGIKKAICSHTIRVAPRNSVAGGVEGKRRGICQWVDGGQCAADTVCLRFCRVS